MEALIIVQARMGSSRFPGKSMVELNGRPMLWYLFHQLSFCRSNVMPILATSDLPGDDVLAEYAESQGWRCFRGSEGDVLGRYHQAALAFGAEPETVVIRVTGDGILPDPHLIDAAIDLQIAFKGQVDCVFTAPGDVFPYGVYVAAFLFRALERANREATDDYDREHVTPYFKKNPDLFPCLEIKPSRPIKGMPLPIDHPEDVSRIEAILLKLEESYSPPFTTANILETQES